MVRIRCLVCLLCHPSHISIHLAFAPFIPVLHVGLDIRLSTSQQTVAQGQLSQSCCNSSPWPRRRQPAAPRKVRKGSHHPAPAPSSSCSRSCFLLLLLVFSLITLNSLYSYFVLDLLLYGQVTACAFNAHRNLSIFKKPSRTSTRYDPW